MGECVPFSMYLCIVLVCVSLNDCHVNSNPCVLGNCILPFFHLFVFVVVVVVFFPHYFHRKKLIILLLGNIVIQLVCLDLQ